MTKTSRSANPVRIGNVLYPVSDVPAAVTYYSAFELNLKFQDGDTFAAFDAGTTFALAAPAEAIAGSSPAVSLRVPDVDAAVAALVSRGGTVVSAPHDGAHERRAAVGDPWGNVAIVYTPLRRPDATEGEQ